MFCKSGSCRPSKNKNAHLVSEQRGERRGTWGTRLELSWVAHARVHHPAARASCKRFSCQVSLLPDGCFAPSPFLYIFVPLHKITQNTKAPPTAYHSMYDPVVLGMKSENFSVDSTVWGRRGAGMCGALRDKRRELMGARGI